MVCSYKRYCAVVVLVAALACNSDRVIEPDLPTYAPNPELVGLPPFSTSLGISNPNNPTNGVNLSTYPRPTLVFLSISGLTTATYIPNQLQQTFDARGRWAGGVYQACYEGVAIQFGTGGTIDFGTCGGEGWYPSPIDPLTKYVVVQGQGSAWWTGARPHASSECNYSPCRSYEGDKSIVVEPVWVDFAATASPTMLDFRDTVTVTMTVSPAQVGGVNVPYSIDSTKWTPAFGTQLNPCQVADFVVVDAQTRRCKKSFTRSGTLSLWATVNGSQQGKTFAINVTPPTFDATASPTTTQGPDSVTFTATVTPSAITWNLSSWIWRADVGTGGVTPSCSWTDKSCKRLVTRSGWMKGSATIGEYSFVDSVHVTVNPPVLDVTATPASIPGAQSVNFNATLTPEPPTPWNLSMWLWRADVGTGGISGPCNWADKTCTQTVSKSGWMKVTAQIGAYSLADSVHVYVGPVSLDVVCTGSGGLRGSVVSCEARPQPATEPLAVASWVFTSTTGDVVTRQTNVTDPTWTGPLVVDGHVDVTGTVGGRSVTGTANVTVTARNWSQRTVHHVVQELTPANLPALPTHPGDLGNHAGFAQAYLPQNGYVQISEGPNQGFFYFTDVPVDALSRIQINRVALSVGSAFYNQQPVSAPTGQCTQADVMPFLPLAEDHEGLTLSPNSHAGVLRNELNRLVPQATEHVTALNDLLLLVTRADAAAAPGIAAAQNASRDQINGGTVPPIPYCAFTY